jgi:membrane protease subunit HflK
MSAAAPAYRTTAPSPPLTQSVGIAFRVLYAAILVLALGWIVGNIREVPPDSRAVVMRFGRVDRVQESGLLLAWPRPIEQIRLLPARDRQIEFRIGDGGTAQPGDTTFETEKIQPTQTISPETDLLIEPNDDLVFIRPQQDADNPDYVLTGDGSAVRLDSRLYYEIDDAVAYVLSEEHVGPALRRFYLTSAVALAARHDLDDFLVARPDLKNDSAENAALAARREAMRGDLAQAINARLDELRRHGADLGIKISRVDLVVLLPPVAKSAFDKVLTAAQIADQGTAAARTDAARITQEAARERDRILSEAHAVAEERVRDAAAAVASIRALESRSDPKERATLLTQAYREQIAAVMQKAGRIDTVDPSGGRHLILPGPDQ